MFKHGTYEGGFNFFAADPNYNPNSEFPILENDTKRIIHYFFAEPTKKFPIPLVAAMKKAQPLGR